MKIERMKISDLLCDPSNVRQHSAKNLDAIKASLLKFSQQKPIVVNKDGIVIAGNGTLIAAKELGWDEISVVRSELGKTEQVAFGIADNRTSDLSEFDRDLLGDQLQALREEDWDLGDLGFDIGDMDSMFKEPEPKEGSKELSEDDFSDFDNTCPKCGFSFDNDKT